ncbi:hypothetical protein ACJX0J_039417, partial [Zea mays]
IIHISKPGAIEATQRLKKTILKIQLLIKSSITTRLRVHVYNLKEILHIPHERLALFLKNK